MRDMERRDVKIAYIGGGSRGWAWQLMGDLAREPALGGEVRLYDIDQEAARCNEVIGNRLSALPEAAGRWRYTAQETLGGALEGADFVIISILPGTFDEMESDVHAPEAYGVLQPVGDTTGPGGMLRALRTGPMYAQFARAIAAHCPQAWVINYTNPMAQCVRTLYEVFPGIRAFGCCHEVFSTQKLLADALMEQGCENLTRHDLRTTVAGVNHFTWVTDARYRDIDVMPIYRAFVEKYAQSGYGLPEEGNWLNRFFLCGHRVKFDLFQRYGAIAAAGDRHLAEFNPAPRYLRSREEVQAWQFSLTPVSWRKQELGERRARAQRLYSGAEQPIMKASDEEGVLQMKALLGMGDMVTNVNLPNRGQIANAPLGAVVETNAAFSGGSLQPVHAGALPAPILALSMPALAAQEQLAAAIAARDATLAFPAFANDPLLVSLTQAQARTLYSDMLRATAAYLPGWKLA